MRRKILPFVALLLFTSSAFSQDSSSEVEYSFVVWFHDGGQVSFPLKSHPVVTHREGTLVVSADDSEVEYLHSSVRKFTLEEALDEEPLPNPDPDPTPDPEPAPELYFVAWFHNGARVSFPFAERPHLTYSEGDIVVATDKEELRYAHADTRKFTLSAEDISQGETTGIGAFGREVRWHRQGDVMVFSAFTPGKSVSIYDGAGRLLQQHIIGSDGTLQIPLSPLAPGMYVVKTESITYKFMKK